MAAPTTNLALCPSTAILGEEIQTANTQLLLSFSNEHSGNKVAGGGPGYLQQARYLPQSRGYYP